MCNFTIYHKYNIHIVINSNTISYMNIDIHLMFVKHNCNI